MKIDTTLTKEEVFTAILNYLEEDTGLSFIAEKAKVQFVGLKSNDFDQVIISVDYYKGE